MQELHNNTVLPIPPDDGEDSMENETAPVTTNATWVDREYIHTPGYVDEYVCETDRFDVPMYHLQDANFNVVGLVDAAGGMLRQYTLDPYGRAIRTEQLDDHAPSRVGHQGLFFDRLDAGITSGGLLPEHLGVTDGTGTNTDTPWLGSYQNRGRTLFPQHQRFGQGDPNGTGMPALDSMTFHGYVSDPSLTLASVNDLHIDGSNRHAAHGNGPLSVTDPTGLFFSLPGMLVGGMEAGITEAMEGYTGWVGSRAGGRLGSILDEYSVNLLFDVEWALDWSTGDDWSSRLGVDSRAYYGGSSIATGGFGGCVMAGGPLAFKDEIGPNRPVHEGPLHDAKCRAWARYLHANGFEEVHFNRRTGAQADALAKNIKTGEYMVVEVEDTSGYTRSELAARKRRLSNYLGVPQSKIEYIQRGVSVSPSFRGTRFSGGGRRGGR